MLRDSDLEYIFHLFKDLKAWHRPQVDCLAAAGADLIAFETIPSIKEAEAVAELLREFPNSNAWLSFSCKVKTIVRSFFISLQSQMSPSCFVSKTPSGWEAYFRRQPVQRRSAGCEQMWAAARRGSQLLSSIYGGAAA